jgi:hypothetical protein
MAARRTGTLLVYAGSIGLVTTLMCCVDLHEILRALRGWNCGRESCTLPTEWSFQQTRDVFMLWFGGLRSVLQIRAGLHMQQPTIEPRRAFVAYLVVAALDSLALASLNELPAWTLGLVVGWPIFVYALTRTAGTRAVVWDSRLVLPRARVIA